MPQLDFSTFPSQIFWLLVSFTVLYLLMAHLALPRVERAIGERRSRIDGDLGGAARMQEEAETVIAAYEKALAEARRQALATMKETTDRLNAIATERQNQASAVIAERTAAAERRIAGETANALADLRAIAVEVATAAATRLVGKPIDTGAAVDAVLRERGL